MLFQTSCPKLRCQYSYTSIRTFDLQSTAVAPDKPVAHKNNEFNMILQLQWEEVIDRVLKR